MGLQEQRMRSPSGLQACGHLALARGQGAPFCHRRCSMCSRAGTDAAVPTSSATSAPLAELAAPCSRPGHCQGVLAPRAAHARGRGGSTKRRRLLQACPTRYVRVRGLSQTALKQDTPQQDTVGPSGSSGDLCPASVEKTKRHLSRTRSIRNTRKCIIFASRTFHFEIGTDES